MKFKLLLLLIFFFEISFSQPSNYINPEGSKICTRFLLPNSYIRSTENENSFGYFLRNLNLKPDGSIVKYHNGSQKTAKNVYDAVIDLEIGKKDLHQCADAVMRLRADYLFGQKRFSDIHFNFTNGFRVDYNQWRNGNRIVIVGDKTSWQLKSKPSDSYESYWNYLETIFSYAGTASLEKELKTARINEIQIGDIFIKGGFPGHAVIVVDVAINPKNNRKLFLLAQSYMPAQELQVLKNPKNPMISPWYELTASDLQTPEWTFSPSQLKRF